LLGKYPGQDRVVLRFLLGGREGPAVELAERVRCCAALVEEVLQELGEDAVRIRSGTPKRAEDRRSAPAMAAGVWPGAAPVGVAPETIQA
jgi:hypothetical protein